MSLGTLASALLVLFSAAGMRAEPLSAGAQTTVSAAVRARAPAPDTPWIVGGAPSAPGDWPNVVALEFPDQQLCTGTVVNSHLVVTAAHCFADNHPADSIRVHRGNSIRESQVIASKTWGVHPQYCGKANCKDDSFDYAYIELQEPIELDRYPLPLTDQPSYDLYMRPGQVLTLIGYGEDDIGDLGVKHEVQTAIARFTPLHRQFLAGGDGKDSCRGDSGGPAFVRDTSGNLWWVGVLSAGLECGKGGYYGVSFSVLAWLNEKTGYHPGGCINEDCLALVPKPDDPVPEPGDTGACSARLAARAPHPGTGALLGLLLLTRKRRRRQPRPPRGTMRPSALL